jgi:hypothetical protein
VHIGDAIHECKCLKVQRFAASGTSAKLYSVSAIARKGNITHVGREGKGREGK